MFKINIEILKVITIITNPKQPLFEDLEKDFLYVKPGIPVLTENPFAFKLPLFVL